MACAGNRGWRHKAKWSGVGVDRGGTVGASRPGRAARDAGGHVRGVWANYACHCTTGGAANRVGGDFSRGLELLLRPMARGCFH